MATQSTYTNASISSSWLNLDAFSPKLGHLITQANELLRGTGVRYDPIARSYSKPSWFGLGKCTWYVDVEIIQKRGNVQYAVDLTDTNQPEPLKGEASVLAAEAFFVGLIAGIQLELRRQA